VRRSIAIATASHGSAAPHAKKFLVDGRSHATPMESCGGRPSAGAARVKQRVTNAGARRRPTASDNAAMCFGCSTHTLKDKAHAVAAVATVTMSVAQEQKIDFATGLQGLHGSV
jgi:hypothetical protein